MVQPVRRFNVIPALPTGLECLRELAYNLRWTWDHDTVELFRRLDRERWEESGHNPVLMLGMVPQERLTAAAAEEGFRSHLNRLWRQFNRYVVSAGTWYSNRDGAPDLLLG